MKPLVCIFAHPDDEAFGPAGTIAIEAKHRDVYIICVTNGDAEAQFTKHDVSTLGKVRQHELRTSAEILGAKDVFFLNFNDGTLCNNLYHTIAEKIESHLKTLRPDMVMTFEHKGISGHIDHIAVSLITTFVCRKLPFVQTLMYYAETEEMISHMADDYFIYMPKGYKREDFDEVYDISFVWETKVAAMRAHKSQSSDADMLLEIHSKLPKEEYFFVDGLKQPR